MKLMSYPVPSMSSASSLNSWLDSHDGIKSGLLSCLSPVTAAMRRISLPGVKSRLAEMGVDMSTFKSLYSTRRRPSLFCPSVNGVASPSSSFDDNVCGGESEFFAANDGDAKRCRHCLCSAFSPHVNRSSGEPGRETTAEGSSVLVSPTDFEGVKIKQIELRTFPSIYTKAIIVKNVKDDIVWKT
uniref:Uncharacterized protein n=1 Tax=Romanomermis culicivorax TaxID=13658 RepID=A0A915HHY1_ROMCU